MHGAGCYSEGSPTQPFHLSPSNTSHPQGHHQTAPKLAQVPVGCLRRLYTGHRRLWPQKQGPGGLFRRPSGAHTGIGDPEKPTNSAIIALGGLSRKAGDSIMGRGDRDERNGGAGAPTDSAAQLGDHSRTTIDTRSPSQPMGQEARSPRPTRPQSQGLNFIDGIHTTAGAE